jgi:AbrB family looped-hinge helix DNA binding protein
MEYNAKDGDSMPTAKVSAKGWVVIPAALREKYRIEPGGRVRIVDYGGVLSIVPSMSDPVHESRGVLKGKTSLTRALLVERRRERRREKRP